MDTGSPCNVIDLRTRLEHFPNTKLYNSDVILHGLGNSELQIVGEILAEFVIDNFHFKEPLIVVKGLDIYPIVILGHKTMEKKYITISPPEKGIYIQHAFYRYSNSICQNFSEHSDSYNSRDIINALNKNTIDKITITEDLSLPPNTPYTIKTKIKSVNPGTEILILSETCKIKGLSLTNAIYKVNTDHTVYIEVMNNLNKNLIIQAGTLISEAEIYNKPLLEIDHEKTPVTKVNASAPLEIDSNKLESINDKIKDIEDINVREQFKKLLTQFPDVLSGKDEPLGYTKAIKHKIRLKDNTPIYIPAYRLPHKYRDEIQKTCKDLLEQGIIEESCSPYNFPLLCIPKKDNTWRVVVDFRKLNDKTIADRHPVPAIDDILNAIGSHKYFTTLDLLSGFLQIPLDDDSKPYTAFSTPTGHYQFNRMPYGLKSAPITFTRCMNKVFADMLGKDIYIYIDDIIIFSNDVADHLQKLTKVLERLREVNLKIKLSKCNFLKRELTYLGHTLTENGLKIVKDKVEAINKFPTPTNTKAILQFLGVSGYYRRYIKNYSTIASPLTSLLKKDVQFTWGEAQENAFNTLKNKLTEAPILIYPNYEKEFFIATDASSVGIGAVLLQKVGTRYHPVSYYSRKLRTSGPDETAYSTIEREAISIINALSHFKYIVFGYEITILTDHKPLLQFFNNYHTSPKRTRWFLILQDFAAKIAYIQGKNNILADTLSRNPLEIAATIPTEIKNLHSKNLPNPTSYDFTLEEFRRSQLDDTNIAHILDVLKGPNTSSEYKKLHETQGYRLIHDMLYKQIRSTRMMITNQNFPQVLVVPKTMVDRVISFFHGHEMNSHPGVSNTYEKIRKIFFWKGMYYSITKYIKTCHTCKQHKGRTPKYDKLLAYPIPNLPFQRVHLDLITNFNETSRSNKHIMVAIDALTRYVEIIPLRNKTAQECSLAFFDNFICKYGVPGMIVTDNGGEFNNRFLDSLSNRLGFKKVNILPYRPEANGLAERVNRKILDALRFSVGGDDPEWDKGLPVIQFTVNNAVHKALGMTPFEALFGFRAKTPFDLVFPENPSETPRDLNNVLNNAQHRFIMLKEKLEKYNVTMRKERDMKANTKQFEEGDEVYLMKNTRFNLNYKLSPRFEGPYTIRKILPHNKYLVEKDGETKICHSTSLQIA